MKALNTFFCLILLSNAIFAQGSIDELEEIAFANPYSLSNQQMLRIINQQNENLRKGHLFLYTNWQNGIVYLKSGQEYEIDSLNLNIINGLFEFTHHGRTSFIDGKKVKKIAINGQNFKYKPYQNEDSMLKWSFFESVESGALNIFRKYIVKERSVSDHPMGIADNNSIKLVKDEILFYSKKEDGLIFPVPNKKNKRYQLFDEDAVSIEKYAKTNKLRVCKNKDFITIVSDYNQK